MSAVEKTEEYQDLLRAFQNSVRGLKAVVESCGGEVRVSPALFRSLDNAHISVQEDPVTKEIVVRTVKL